METFVGILDDAICFGQKIDTIIETDRDKKKILGKVGNAIRNVNLVLDFISKNKMSVDIEIMHRVLEGLKLLRRDVERVKDIGRFMYLLRRNDCQERLLQEIETVRFHLHSLIVSQINSANGKINSVYGQTQEIERILAQLRDNSDLEEELEDERQQAEELRRQVGVNKLQLQQLHSMGLGTDSELKIALHQAAAERQRQLNNTADSKSKSEALYLQHVIQLLKATAAPSRTLDIPACPISHQPLDYPVILHCTCQRQEEQSPTNKGPPMCPICGQLLHSIHVTPNMTPCEILEANLFPPPPDNDPMVPLAPTHDPQSQLPHHDEVKRDDTHLVVDGFLPSQTSPLFSPGQPLFRYVRWDVWTMEAVHQIDVTLTQFWLLHRHDMQMVQQPSTRHQSSYGPYLGFQDHSLATSMFCPRVPGKRLKTLGHNRPQDDAPAVDVAFGWNRETAKPAPRPPSLPNGLIRAVLANSEFLQVLERLERYFKNQSIQAIFCDSPPSVKLQTLDLVEFSIKFWEAPDDQFCVDIQIRRGDDFKLDNIIRPILDAMRGVEPSTKSQNEAAMNYKKTQEMHVFLKQLVPHQALTDSNLTQQKIVLLHSQLVSPSFSGRASGLDCLIHATDIRCTMAASAREIALMILSGKSAIAQTSEAFEQKCRDIHDVLIQVLVTREFSDDEPWNNEIAESRYPPFVTSRSDVQGFTDNAMISSIQKVLMVLSNSLEVLTCYGVDSGSIRKLFSSFLSQCSGVARKSLASTLTSLMIDGCHQCLAIAYMACRVLRLLSVLHPPLTEELRTDSWIRECVETAFQTGRIRYALLETESLLLLNGIMV